MTTITFHDVDDWEIVLGPDEDDEPDPGDDDLEADLERERRAFGDDA